MAKSHLSAAGHCSSLGGTGSRGWYRSCVIPGERECSSQKSSREMEGGEAGRGDLVYVGWNVKKEEEEESGVTEV